MTGRSAPRARTILLAVLLVVSALSATTHASRQEPRPDTEVRALWVTRFTLASPALIDRLIATARDGGFNTVIVQVRGRGDAYYRSTLEPSPPEIAVQPGFDPLRHLLLGAHAAGLKVHAWLAIDLVASALDLPTAPQHIVHRQPDWLMVPRELAEELWRIDPRSPDYVTRLARWSRAHAGEVEGLYASPIHTWAVTHLTAVVRELVATYNVDGIHLDYARYPSEQFDYSRAAVQQFKLSVRPQLSGGERREADKADRTNPLAYTDLFPDRWAAFRRDRLTSLVSQLRTTLKQARPDIVLSAAVFPSPDDAFSRRFQDWRGWLAAGLVDVLCPMVYTTDAGTFDRQVQMAMDAAGTRPVWAGIGAYRLPPSGTLERIEATRRLGSAGFVLFSYETFADRSSDPVPLAEIGRRAVASRVPR